MHYDPCAPDPTDRSSANHASAPLAGGARDAVIRSFCPQHNPQSMRLGYVAYFAWLGRQRGEQRRCPRCHRWMFRSEFGRGWDQALRAPSREAAEAAEHLIDDTEAQR
jgi:hypothetical protein